MKNYFDCKNNRMRMYATQMCTLALVRNWIFLDSVGYVAVKGSFNPCLCDRRSRVMWKWFSKGSELVKIIEIQ